MGLLKILEKEVGFEKANKKRRLSIKEGVPRCTIGQEQGCCSKKV